MILRIAVPMICNAHLFYILCLFSFYSLPPPSSSLPPLLCSIYTPHPQDVAFPEDQTITCNDFQGLSDTQELNNPPNFYSSSSPLSQLENPLTTEQEQQQQQQQQPLCPGVPCGGQLPLPAACPVVPFIPWPAGNPLYGMLSCCGV